MPAPLPLVLDTDPGQDDALAILLALAMPERLDLRAICTVAGNVPLPLTTANALRLVELAARPEVPVHPGCDRPLIEPLRTAEFVCGPDGLAGAGLPPPRLAPSATHAVPALLALLEAAPPQGLTICALGPLTNLAVALAQRPDLARRIARLVVMGGARDLGNITADAEFNFHVDPHAAKIVLAAGVPVTLFGLHATHQAMATPARSAAIASLGTATARAVAGMLSRPRPGGRERFGADGHPMHDPCTVAWLLWPELFSGKDCFVDVETASALTLGRSSIDWWGRSGRPPNAFVVDRLDADALFARITEALARLP
jgi:purine nucleosidase